MSPRQLRRRAQVLQAMVELHAGGKEAVGPSEVARHLGKKWCFHHGVLPATGTLTPLMQSLVLEGLVERITLGIRRGKYRVIREEVL